MIRCDTDHIRKSLEKQNINERLRTQERPPIHRVYVGNRKGIPVKWNNMCEAMKSNVCSWSSKETS